MNEKFQIGLKRNGAKSTLKNFDAELQKRLLKVSRGARKAYFTQGHGERNVKSSSLVDKEDKRGKMTKLKEFLQAQSYEVKSLSAADGLSSAVPDDAAMVVIAGSTGEMVEPENRGPEGVLR